MVLFERKRAIVSNNFFMVFIILQIVNIYVLGYKIKYHSALTVISTMQI